MYFDDEKNHAIHHIINMSTAESDFQPKWKKVLGIKDVLANEEIISCGSNP